MAPSVMAFVAPPHQKAAHSGDVGAAAAAAEALQRRNRELEMELRKSAEREEMLRGELRRAAERVALLEDAEERLCSQLGEFEAEAVDQARLYYAQIVSLKDQLSQAQHKLLKSSKKL
ncbi:hypothetical protein Sjap_005849 [Stephania japonica]|uniref:Uncharacterized protein n=1 Tax=Stephania japonica TaxID=461633 RepID=A0AAP0PM99_9MAGN